MSQVRDAYNITLSCLTMLEAKVDYLESDQAVSAGYLSSLALELEQTERQLHTLRREMIARLMEKPCK